MSWCEFWVLLPSLRHAENSNELFVINQTSSWQLPQRLWRRNTRIGFGTSKLLSTVSVINRLGQRPPEARALLGCDKECQGRRAGTLAIVTPAGPRGPAGTGAGDQRLSHRNGESLYSNLVSGHQPRLSMINVLNWPCVSTLCSKGWIGSKFLGANIYEKLTLA